MFGFYTTDLMNIARYHNIINCANIFLIGEVYMKDKTETKILEGWDNTDLLSELDKGIDDMENGRLHKHEDTMKILKQRLRDYAKYIGDEDK